MILTARIVSMLFTPFYLPILGLATLFMFSYLSMFPLIYKIQVLALTYLFTILMPTLLIHLYRRYQGWNLIELGQRERRMVPYIISITCYFTCIYVMERLHMPHFMSSIIVAALLVQMICALINIWWKISTHTAAIGGVGGALFAFSFYLGFNPVWWLCLVFLNCRHLRQLSHDSPSAQLSTGSGRILGWRILRRYSDITILRVQN